MFTTTQIPIKKEMPNSMVNLYSYIVNFIFALNLKLSKRQINHILIFMHGNILIDGRKTV